MFLVKRFNLAFLDYFDFRIMYTIYYLQLLIINYLLLNNSYMLINSVLNLSS